MRALENKLFDVAFAQVIGANISLRTNRKDNRLDSLFKDLERPTPARDPNETMELIWAIWIDHRDAAAAHRMFAAVEAIAAGARDLARPMLDDLVNAYPDWAEAWNKRATLAYMEKRDNDSVADILSTLKLEPRHFGAILGFAQISMRHGRITEAKAAFEIAMRLNPHIDGLAEIVEDLSSARPLVH
jgi:Tfp pilus assembly protein PilF